MFKEEGRVESEINKSEKIYIMLYYIMLYCYIYYIILYYIILYYYYYLLFSSLSDDRSKASSKTIPPYSAIQSLLFQMRASSPVLKVIQ